MTEGKDVDGRGRFSAAEVIGDTDAGGACEREALEMAFNVLPGVGEGLIFGLWPGVEKETVGEPAEDCSVSSELAY